MTTEPNYAPRDPDEDFDVLHTAGWPTPNAARMSATVWLLSYEYQDDDTDDVRTDYVLIDDTDRDGAESKQRHYDTPAPAIAHFIQTANKHRDAAADELAAARAGETKPRSFDELSAVIRACEQAQNAGLDALSDLGLDFPRSRTDWSFDDPQVDTP